MEAQASRTLIQPGFLTCQVHNWRCGESSFLPGRIENPVSGFGALEVWASTSRLLNTKILHSTFGSTNRCFKNQISTGTFLQRKKKKADLGSFLKPKTNSTRGIISNIFFFVSHFLEIGTIFADFLTFCVDLLRLLQTITYKIMT